MMNNLMVYIIESTISITVFYMISKILIKKDADFDINRMVLLSIISISLILPQIQLPFISNAIGSPEMIQNSSISLDYTKEISLLNKSENFIPFPVMDEFNPTDHQSSISLINLLLYVYLCGAFAAFSILIRNVSRIIKVFKHAEIRNKDEFRLVIVDDEIPSFSFMKSVIISRKDYHEHKPYIFNHELAHIRLKHYYDLILLEMAKIVFWFNPVTYLLVNDLKKIHEFQADNYTLKTGVNSVQYQLLIIEKSVGEKRFALVNSFNQSEVKQRIEMINNPIKKRSLKWKLLALTGLSILLVFTFSSFTTTFHSTDNNYTKTDIQGTWKLISYNHWGGDNLQMASPEKDRLKFIKDNSFCWIDIKTENNKVEDSAGGVYNLSGNNYNEFIEYGGTGMTNFTNNKQKFTIKIEHDIMYLTGVLSSGLKIKEVWIRHHE